MSRKLKYTSDEERAEHEKQYAKEYYQMHKEKIMANLYELKHCNCCNKDIMKYKFQPHCRSNKHMKSEQKLIVSFD